jgi:hypothetical protein
MKKKVIDLDKVVPALTWAPTVDINTNGKMETYVRISDIYEYLAKRAYPIEIKEKENDIYDNL